MNDARLLLKRRHRLALWEKPLWIAVATLIADIVLAQLGVDAPVRAGVWASALILAISVRIFFGPSLHATARALDAKAGTRNRLESFVALGKRQDALARAIEKEVTGHLTKHPLPRPYLWMIGLGLFVALGFAQLAPLRFLADSKMAATCDARQDLAMPHRVETIDEPRKKIAPVPMPSATLRWVEPLSALVATAHETVPLIAESNCSVGLTDLQLRLTIAGETLASLPQPGSMVAGVQTLPLALDLTRLDAKPFSFVTYHLTAERGRDHVNTATPDWPRIFSPLQLIQIRPVGSELSLALPPDDAKADNETERLLFRVKRLKFAQIGVLRAVFALAHDRPERSPGWQESCKTVTDQERGIWQEMTALIPVLEKNLRVFAAMEPAQRTLSEIQNAWDVLVRTEPANAFTPAERGLAGLAEVEKVLTETVEKLREEKSAKDEGTVAAVAQDAAFQLPPRDKTPAGRIEALARLQQELADRLTDGTEVNAFTRQDAIARALLPLAADPGFSPEIQSAIAAAEVDAKDAAQHLNDLDSQAAIEPATRAAQALQTVAATLDTAGRSLATEAFAKAQRSFNTAALEVNEGDFAAAAKAVADAQRDVRSKALRQQNVGSASSAQQLLDLSAAMDVSTIKEDLSKLKEQSPPSPRREREIALTKLTQLALRAAESRKRTQSEDERATELENAADQLRRAQANAERAAVTSDEELADLFLKAQEHAQQSGKSLPLPPSEADGVPSEKNTVTAQTENPPKSKEKDGESPPPSAASKTNASNAVSKNAKSSAQGPSEKANPSKKDKSKNSKPPRKPEEGERALPPGDSDGDDRGESTRSRSIDLGDKSNREKYGRVLSDEIGRVVTLLAEERRRLQRAQVLTTATPAEAPPAYRSAVAKYFEALARAGTKNEPPSKPSTP